MINQIKDKLVYIFLLTLISILITFYSGYRGVLPLDSFLIFNSGYNITIGYFPFKDYWSITGPILDYIQYLFFLVFKINWFSYVLHAAIFNFIITIFTYYFLCKIGLKNYLSFLYSLGTAFLVYSQTGTPFMDHHSFIFSYLSVGFLSLGILYRKNSFWFFSSFFLTLSFFSKQIPSAYFLILSVILIILWLIIFRKDSLKNIFSFLFGFIVSLSLVFFVFLMSEIPIENFIIQYILYPLSLGEERSNNLRFDLNLISQFKLIYISIIPLFLSILYFYRKKNFLKNEFKNLIFLIFIIFTSFIFIYAQMMTKNQILIFGLIPLYLGISHFYNQNFFNKKIISTCLITILLISVSKYHLRYNYSKNFMDLDKVNFDLAVDANALDKKLSGLKWITPHYKDNPKKEIKLLLEAKQLLKSDSSNKILITNYQIMPSIIENDLASPNKWYDYLSVPSKKNYFFKDYKIFFKKKLKENKIKNIYILGKKITYIDNIFEKNKCISYEQKTEILLKANIEKCNL